MRTYCNVDVYIDVFVGMQVAVLVAVSVCVYAHVHVCVYLGPHRSQKPVSGRRLADITSWMRMALVVDQWHIVI